MSMEVKLFLSDSDLKYLDQIVRLGLYGSSVETAIKALAFSRIEALVVSGLVQKVMK